MSNAILWTIVMAVLAACSAHGSAVWSPYERSGLGRGDGVLVFGRDRVEVSSVERMISRPLDDKNLSRGKFDLYYFIHMPIKKRATKTVLFIQGGPGRYSPGPIEDSTMADFLIRNDEYNVAYFHVRGAGFSQVPGDNSYDRFLKTSFVVEDIEAIRSELVDLGILGADGRWDAVIGYSYGTVVAQHYAASYQNALRKLVLIGAESRHLFDLSDTAFTQITAEIRETNRTTLTKIFESFDPSEFPNMSPDKIVDVAFGTAERRGLFQLAEAKFGSLGFLQGSYCQLEVQEELKKNGWDRYSSTFFRALRELRHVGWHPNSPDRKDQIQLAKRIRDEISKNGLGGDKCPRELILDRTGSSDRVFYAVTIFDGINLRLLDALQRDPKKHVHEALRRSGGEAHYEKRINKFIDKVGVSDNEIIVPWNPGRPTSKKYDGPTMILKGTADTVSAGGAAEHFFVKALTGRRVLLVYPGIGHSYRLPLIPLEAWATAFPSPNVCEPDGEGKGIRDCLIYSFLEMTPEAFVDPNDNKILRVLIKANVGICYGDGNTIRSVAGSCPQN